MPFNPKLVSAAEPRAEAVDEFDGQLPEDLRALAAQLESEAQRLSELYPAQDSAAEIAVGRLSGGGTVLAGGHSKSGGDDRSGRQGRWLAVSVAGLLASGLLGTVGWVVMQSHGTVADRHRLPQAGNSVAARPGPSSAVENLPDTRAIPPARFSSDPGGRQEPVVELHAPGWFLQEVSGPELEGLLDLLEEQPDGSWNISI